LSIRQPRLFQQKFFNEWFHGKMKERREALPATADDPKRPLKKGIPPGKRYEWSQAKYAAALCCVFFGEQLPEYKVRLKEVAEFVSEKAEVGYGLLRVWRSEKTFMDEVSRFRREFAASYYKEAYEQKNLRLATRIEYLSQLVTYPLEVMNEITSVYYERQGITKRNGYDESETALQARLYRYLSTCFIWSLIDDYEEVEWMKGSLILMMDDEAIDQKDGNKIVEDRFRRIDEIVGSEIRQLIHNKNTILIEDICYIHDFKSRYITELLKELE